MLRSSAWQAFLDLSCFPLKDASLYLSGVSQLLLFYTNYISMVKTTGTEIPCYIFPLKHKEHKGIPYSLCVLVGLCLSGVFTKYCLNNKTVSVKPRCLWVVAFNAGMHSSAGFHSCYTFILITIQWWKPRWDGTKNTKEYHTAFVS